MAPAKGENEAVATYVSLVNHCHYSIMHHSANMRRLVGDELRGEAMYAALACGHPEVAFEGDTSGARRAEGAPEARDAACSA